MSDTKSDSMEPLPRDSASLIDKLDEEFPAECIRPGEDFMQAHRRAGQREVIEFLRNWQDFENERAKEAQDDLPGIPRVLTPK